MIKSFDDLINQKFSNNSTKKKLAVVCADSEHTLEGVIQAHQEGLVHPLLIGDKGKITPILHKLDYFDDDMEIIQADTIAEALKIMVELAQKDQINAVMKGNMDTKDILSAIVKKENGLAESNVMNAITLTQIPDYHKLMMFADPGMIISPTMEQKAGIIHNCLRAFRALGYEKPKVAVLSCVEKVNPKIESTVHAINLMDMADAGVFGECELYGPLSYDLIISKNAAEIKGVNSSVCGDADLVLVPDINCGNTLVKVLTYNAHAVGGGVALGAKIPVILPSRASSRIGKYYAIIMGCALQSQGGS